MEYTQIRIQTGTNSSLSHMSYGFSTLPWKREDRTHMFYWQCCMCTMMHKMFSLISEASVIFSKQLWVFGLFGGFIVFYFILFFPLPFTSSMPSSKQNHMGMCNFNWEMYYVSKRQGASYIGDLT